MKGKRKWLLCPLIVAVLLLCAIPAYADTPVVPHAFYGTLTVSGSPAAVGTEVTAKVNDVECGSITTTVAGQYGGSGAFDAKLTVTGEGIQNGDTISFFVNDVDTTQTYAFSAGAVTELNLMVEDDTEPPDVDLTPLSPDPTNDNTPTFTGTAVDTLSHIASVEYQVGTGSWRAWVAATAVDGAFDEPSEEYTFTIPALADGGYTVQVRATDSASPPNTTLEANYATDTFTVDATAPTVTDRYPASGQTSVPVTAVVTATFSEAMDETTINTSSFTLKIDSTPVAGSVSYNSGTYIATFTPDADLTDDTVYTANLSTAVTDVAGNALGAASTWNFTTGEVPDITPPSVTITPLSPDPTEDTTPTLTGTATDTQSNISGVDYKVDDGGWASATASDGTFDSLSEGYTFTTPTLSAGEHTVYARATDTAHNTTLEADYATDTFTVEPPTCIPGDANEDGTVNALDITKVERIIALLDAETCGADANEDGTVNALDITKIERIIALLD